METTLSRRTVNGSKSNFLLGQIGKKWCAWSLLFWALPMAAQAYLADAYPASVTRMREWLATRGTAPAVLYSWTPERYRTTDSPHDWRPIPQHLRERFGR